MITHTFQLKAGSSFVSITFVFVMFFFIESETVAIPDELIVKQNFDLCWMLRDK